MNRRDLLKAAFAALFAPALPAIVDLASPPKREEARRALCYLIRLEQDTLSLVYRTARNTFTLLGEPLPQADHRGVVEACRTPFEAWIAGLPVLDLDRAERLVSEAVQGRLPPRAPKARLMGVREWAIRNPDAFLARVVRSVAEDA